jgi:hypothetical protein
VGEGVDEARDDRQRRQDLRVAPAGVVSVVAGTECPANHPAAVVIDVEHCCPGGAPLHIAQQPGDLDRQPGLLGYLANHRMCVGLTDLHPATGNRPASPSRLVRSSHQQQPARVVEDHCPDAPDPLLGRACHQRSW